MEPSPAVVGNMAYGMAGLPCGQGRCLTCRIYVRCYAQAWGWVRSEIHVRRSDMEPSHAARHVAELQFVQAQAGATSQ